MNIIMYINCVLAKGVSSLSKTLWLAIVIVCEYIDGALGDSTRSSITSTTEATAEADDKSGMIKGMAAGFGGFFAILALVCILWCCCCANEESSCRCCCKKKKHTDKNCPIGKSKAPNKRKIAPSPPESVASWSRSH